MASLWRDRLYERFCNRPHPLLVFSDAIVPASVQWNVSRRWVDVFKTLKIAPGERVAVLLPPGTAFVAVLLAALWCDVTLVILPPSYGAAEALRRYDAVCTVSQEEHEYGINVTASGEPGAVPASKRTPVVAPTPEVRLFVRSGGAEGKARTIGLSDANIMAVLETLQRAMPLDESSRMLSVLPWTCCLGLLADLLAGLFSGAVVVRAPHTSPEGMSVPELARRHEVSHLNMMPSLAENLAATAEGLALLRTLSSGMVGGAPIRARLAGALKGTRLRSAYGIVEGGSLMCLGRVGEWKPLAIGRALGCEIRVDPISGEMSFRGANACAGWWTDGVFERPYPGAWVRTGDVVEYDDDGSALFAGRVDGKVKMSDGACVDCPAIEQQLRTVWSPESTLVFTDDGSRLWVAVRGETPPEVFPIEALGIYAARFAGVVSVPASLWEYRRKGEVDRIATTREILQEELIPSA